MTRALHILSFVLLVLASACGGGDAGEWAQGVAAGARAAERAQASGDVAGARRELQEILERDVPEGVAPTDARVVRQDAATRLSALALKEGDAASALRWAERAVNLGEAEDVFAAGAHIARGRALEALGRAPEATADYHRALTIDEALLGEALNPPDDPSDDGAESR